jgi:hypothetical protein
MTRKRKTTVGIFSSQQPAGRHALLSIRDILIADIQSRAVEIPTEPKTIDIL